MEDAGRVGFLIRGDYDTATTYDFLDIVFFNGSSYVAKKETTGNEPVRKNEYWQIFAEGSSISTGVSGIKGNAEADYRTGNVNLTPENIGALPSTGGTITGNLSVSGDVQVNGTNINEGKQDALPITDGKYDIDINGKAKSDSDGNIIRDTYGAQLSYSDSVLKLLTPSGIMLDSVQITSGESSSTEQSLTEIKGDMDTVKQALNDIWTFSDTGFFYLPLATETMAANSEKIISLNVTALGGSFEHFDGDLSNTYNDSFYYYLNNGNSVPVNSSFYIIFGQPYLLYNSYLSLRVEAKAPAGNVMPEPINMVSTNSSRSIEITKPCSLAIYNTTSKSQAIGGGNGSPVIPFYLFKREKYFTL